MGCHGLNGPDFLFASSTSVYGSFAFRASGVVYKRKPLVFLEHDNLHLTLHGLILPSKVRMSDPFVAYPRTSTLFTEHVECQEAWSQYCLNSKRVAKWRISASLVSWRISDVKAESRLTWRARAIPSRIQLMG
jgi:hypothetical protein